MPGNPNRVIPTIKTEAQKPEPIHKEDLEVLEYKQLPGGPLGRITHIKVRHPVDGDFLFGIPLPMSQEAAIEWIELTIPVKTYKRGSLDASHHLDAGEKEPSLWEGDPLAPMNPEDRAAFIQGIRDKALEPWTCKYCTAVNRETYTCKECGELKP